MGRFVAKSGPIYSHDALLATMLRQLFLTCCFPRPQTPCSCCCWSCLPRHLLVSGVSEPHKLRLWSWCVERIAPTPRLQHTTHTRTQCVFSAREKEAELPSSQVVSRHAGFPHLWCLVVLLRRPRLCPCRWDPSSGVTSQTDAVGELPCSRSVS